MVMERGIFGFFASGVFLPHWHHNFVFFEFVGLWAELAS